MKKNTEISFYKNIDEQLPDSDKVLFSAKQEMLRLKEEKRNKNAKSIKIKWVSALSACCVVLIAFVCVFPSLFRGTSDSVNYILIEDMQINDYESIATYEKNNGYSLLKINNNAEKCIMYKYNNQILMVEETHVMEINNISYQITYIVKSPQLNQKTSIEFLQPYEVTKLTGQTLEFNAITFYYVEKVADGAYLGEFYFNKNQVEYYMTINGPNNQWQNTLEKISL